MATRNDIDIDFVPSPRIATVAEPSTEFIAQDVVDTLRIGEESWRGQTETKLLNASGKEELGGGVQVGITVALQDTQIAFESRTAPAETGTVTTASSAPVNSLIDLYDINATFQTNNIQRGSLVINFDDQSIAEVYSVESETQLKTKIPVNGAENDFDIGDNYQVFNVIQCEISGGNVVATDDIGGELSPVLPTAFTQIIRTAASSATTQNQIDITYGAYNGSITIDVINGDTTANGATGTRRLPFNNLADALAGDVILGFNKLFIIGGFTFPASANLDNYDIQGQGQGRSEIILTAGCSTSNTKFFDADLTGVANGALSAERCEVKNISGVGCTIYEIFFTNCTFEDTITLRGDNIVDFHIHDCKSGAPGVSTPILDINNTNTPYAFRNWIGGIEIINNTQNNNASIDAEGHVILGTSITSGAIIVRGRGKLTIAPAAQAYVDSSHFLTGDKFTNLQFMVERLISYTTSFGDVWFVDPTNGLDTNVGTDPQRAFSTIGTALNAATNNNGDIIFIITTGTDEVDIDETLNITKSQISIRAAGTNVHIHPSTSGTDTITITGQHITLENLTVHAAAGSPLGQDNGIVLTGSHGSALRNVRIENVTGRGLVLNAGCDQFQVFDSFIGYSGSHGVEITDCHDVTFWTSHIDTNANDNVKLNSTNPGDLHEVAFRNTIIHEAGGWGVNIGTNCETVQFFDRCKFILNTLGDVLDNGITTYIENDKINQSTASVVWTKIAAGSPSQTYGDILSNVGSSTDTIQVDITNILSVTNEIIKYSKNRTKIDPIAYTLTIYDNDDITPLRVFDLKDENGIATVTSIFERIKSTGSPSP